MTFQDIMAFAPMNQSVYDRIKQNLSSLIPFGGAGFSAAFYRGWGDALKALSENCPDRAGRQKINSLLKKGKYLEAAQALEDSITPHYLASAMGQYFSPEKLKGREEELRDSAAAVLPRLFPDLVLTTNFDRVLEWVYEDAGRAFQEVLPPGHGGRLTRLVREGGSRCLYKFHGTVTPDGGVEYGKIVFTEAQYEKHYAPDSPWCRNCEAPSKAGVCSFWAAA